MTVPQQLTSSLPSFSYPASFRHPPPASSLSSGRPLDNLARFFFNGLMTVTMFAFVHVSFGNSCDLSWNACLVGGFSILSTYCLFSTIEPGYFFRGWLNHQLRIQRNLHRCQYWQSLRASGCWTCARLGWKDFDPCGFAGFSIWTPKLHRLTIIIFDVSMIFNVKFQHF